MSVSKGQALLAEYLTLLMPGEYIENYRPEWLGGLEIDFYYPKINVGFEFNGAQHYVSTDFGSPEKQISRDKTKNSVCKKNGCVLVTVDALDLVTCRLLGRLRQTVYVRLKQIGYTKKDLNYDKRKTKMLDSKSNAYRKTLRSFNDPTGSYNHKQLKKRANGI